MATYYCGVDVGTSRSSIVTSTGERLTVESCIGYPKDVIAEKRVGNKPYLLGKTALENRLALDIIYPLENGVLHKDERSLEGMHFILKDILSSVFPSLKKDDVIYAAVGTPAQASIEDNKSLLKVCSGIFKKVLIVSEPFAVSYALNIFEEALIIDIGAGTVDILRVTGSFPRPEDQISLTTAGNFLDERVESHLLKEYPKVQSTKGIIRDMKEKFGYADMSFHESTYVLTEEGKPRILEIHEILQRAVRELVSPICRSVQQLIAGFDPEFQEKLRNNIVVAGGGSRLRGIDRAIEASLKDYGGGSVRCTEDPEFGGAVGALQLALEMPDDLWNEIKEEN